MTRTIALLVSLTSLLVAQQDCVVEGRVVNSLTHAGIDGVGVLLYTNDATYEATTDATGGFRISSVKPGDYKTTFNKTGFLVPIREFPAGIQWPVHVSAGNDPVRIDIEMAPWAKLAGRVLDSDGKPAAGIEVHTSFAKPVHTDSDGKFDFDGLQAGSYTLLAKPARTEAERIVPLPTYFPSALDPAQAEPIGVAAGATMSGFEIRLRSAPVYRVRGQVLDQSGKPAPRAAVTLSGLAMTKGCQRFGSYYLDGHAQLFIGGDCPGGPPGAEARTDDDGTFEFPAVSAGEWSIRADYEGAWDDVRNMPIIQLSSGKVNVSHEDIEDLRIRVAALVPLQATVDWGDTPAPDAARKASLMLISEYGGGFGNKDLVTGPDQAPTLVPAGRTLIADGRPVDGYVLVSVLFGGREALGEVVDWRPRPPLCTSSISAQPLPSAGLSIKVRERRFCCSGNSPTAILS